MPRAKEGDEQRAQANEPPFDDHIRPFGRKSEQEDEANREVKEPPQDIDDRRGFADARWGGERGLEPVAADPLNEMRHAIGQKQSGDKLQQVDIPGKRKHGGFFY